MGDTASTDGVLVGSNVDVRTVMHWKVDDDAVRSLLPQGWLLAPVASGPAEGANLRITMIETVAAEDAQGKSRPVVSYMHAGVPMRRDSGDDPGLLLFAGLSPGGAGPYGTNLQATTTLERHFRHDGTCTVCEETWSLRSDAADVSATFNLVHDRGPLVRERGSAHVHSRAKQGFRRIYQYDQWVDVVCERGATPRIRAFEFRALGGSFAPLFNGRERLVSVIAIPSYARQVFLPATKGLG